MKGPLAVGAGPQAGGLTVLFEDTGMPNPNAFKPVPLFEPRAVVFHAVVAIPSGGAWVVGKSVSGRVAVLKVTASNTRDASFGSDGFVEIGDPEINVTAIGLDAQGRVLVAAAKEDWNSEFPPPEDHPVVMRLTPSGALDPTYGAGGVAKLPLLTPRLYTFGIVVERSGAVLVPGLVPDAGGGKPRRAGIVRLDPDGKLDVSFGGPGTGGVVTAPVRPGMAADADRAPQGVVLAASPAQGTCEGEFFALFQEAAGPNEPPGLGYVFY